MEHGAGKPSLAFALRFPGREPFFRLVGTGGDFWDPVDEDRYAAALCGFITYESPIHVCMG